jgi:hypothetical protein
MSLGAKDKDQIIKIAVISAGVLFILIYGYFQLRVPDAPPPVVAPVIVTAPARPGSAAGSAASTGSVPRAAQAGVAANKVGTTASQYDPTLKMEAILVTESLAYSGTGRNIFSSTSAPVEVAIPKMVAPARKDAAAAPAYTPPPGPPPPPPIDLKFFGTATKVDGSRQAFLLHGDDVFLAAVGTIVQRRYKVGTISANAVEVTDLTNNNTQSLPLTRN